MVPGGVGATYSSGSVVDFHHIPLMQRREFTSLCQYLQTVVHIFIKHFVYSRHHFINHDYG